MKRQRPSLSAISLAAVALAARSGHCEAAAVPAPWTALEVRGESLACWGRDHVVQGALPGRIVSQGQALLAGPINLRLDGEPLEWQRTPFDSQAAEVRWSAAGRRGPVEVSLRTSVEYDGFWKVDVEVGPGEVSSLSLDIPLTSAHARYLHFVDESHYQEPNTLTLPEGDGELWSARFACMAWLGDEDVGLAWCADTPAPLHLAQPGSTLSISRAGDVTLLRVNLIDHPVMLREGLKWAFGLVATPVRPLPAGWRNWRLSPGESANIHILWWNSWTATHADLVPEDPDSLRAQVQAIRDKEEHVLPYVALLALSERAAAYQQGGDRWRREPFSKLEDEGTPYWIVCPNTSWQEYFPRQMEELCRGVGFNGLYVDWTFPYLCDAAHHGCGFVDSTGRRQGEFRVFALRELTQQTYERVKAADPEARILLHTSGAMMYPYIGFGDLMVNGEQLRQPLAKAGGHYMDVLPLATLRAEYRGQHAGLAPFIIPELATPEGLPDPVLTGAPGATEEMLALALLHDIGVWPIYCHLESVEAVRQVQREFGIAEAKFVGYWEDRGPLDMTSPGTVASAWSRPTSMLVAVANLEDEAVETRARLRPGLLSGERARTAVDAITGVALDFDGAEIVIRVPARGFRLLRLGSAEP